MADVEKITAELRENLASFDAEVAYELENDGERADLWTDIDVPVEGLRALLDGLDRLREALVMIRDEPEVHTKLNQERLCCKFQDIAARALSAQVEERE